MRTQGGCDKKQPFSERKTTDNDYLFVLHGYHNNAVILTCVSTRRQCKELLTILRLIPESIKCSLRQVLYLLVKIRLIGCILQIVKQIIALNSCRTVYRIDFLSLLGFELYGCVLLCIAFGHVVEQRCEHGAAVHIMTVDNHVSAVNGTVRVEERYSRNAVVSVKTPVKIFLRIVRGVHYRIVNGCAGDCQPRDTLAVDFAQRFKIMDAILIGITAVRNCSKP